MRTLLFVFFYLLCASDVLAGAVPPVTPPDPSGGGASVPFISPAAWLCMQTLVFVVLKKAFGPRA